VHLPPLPPPERGEPPAVRETLEAARARLASGASLSALDGAVALGAVIHALIEDGTPERRPGLVVVAPAGPPPRARPPLDADASPRLTPRRRLQ